MAGSLYGCDNSSKIKNESNSSVQGFASVQDDPSNTTYADLASIQNDQSYYKYHDFTTFREDRMKLPEGDEITYLSAFGEIGLSWKTSLNIKEKTELVEDWQNPDFKKNEKLQSAREDEIRMFLPKGFQLQKSLPQYRLIKTEIFDLDQNGTKEQLALQNGELSVKTSSQIIWQSDANWWIDYFFAGDTNNDGTIELNMIVWKEGSFGPNKPFWIEEENTEVKNHLFIFKLEHGIMKPVWQSSNLDQPNYCVAIVDVNEDGSNELIAMEGSYTDLTKTDVTLWKWNGWGFSRMDEN
ncbi:hypothetical protein [Calidifontibacillus oryziterrae]|uniref:hypothetical protein n=1 Tax=Calidifontibacillus oryziterrae TaxID=1191699 RepID=UPI00037A9387|nr:hypothetical protein [Calidifontibacillus oryziterrae]